MILDFFKLSINNLRKKKVRSWLTIIGIVLGTLTIVALIALGQGMQNAVEDQVLKIAGNKLRVVPGSLQGPPIGREDITIKDVEQIKRIPGVDYVSEFLINNAIIEFSKEEKSIGVVGVNPKIIKKDDEDLNIKLLSGRHIVPSDNNVAIIGYYVANDFFEKKINSKNSIIIGGKKYKVIGIYKKTGSQILDNSIRIPLLTAQRQFDQKNIVSLITVKANKGILYDDLAESIIKKLKRTRDDENFEVYTAQSIMNQINNILDIIKAILISIASISLFVGALGIMNSMFTSVYERTKEIGIMKALGAKNINIFTIILIDSGIMGLIGGVIGVIFGYLFAFLISFGAKLGGFNLLTITFDYPLLFYNQLYCRS